MRILVDADACPVRNIIVEEAREHGIEVLMFTDVNHIIEDTYSSVVMVDQGRDSVDFAIANCVKKDDVVITQDYGVAAVVLSKGAVVLNQNGMEFNSRNIEQLMFERFMSQKARKAGEKLPGMPKRSERDNIKFRNAIKGVINN